VGEYRFHSWIRDLCATEHNVPPDAHFQVTVDIGDDAAVLKLPMFREYEVVLTTDAAPASLSRLPMRTAKAADNASELDGAKYVGRFSVVHSLSDVLAMGAIPVAVLLNMHLPRETRVSYAMEVVRTVLEEAKKYGAALIGGDIKERGERSIGCVGVGMVRRGHAIRRKGGKPGDVLAITQASNPRTGVPRRIGCRWAQELLEHRRLANEERFRPLLDTSWKRELLFLPREIAQVADQYPGLIKAAMDTSDGVMACLQLMGRESNIHFLLKEALIEQIIDEKVKMIATHLGVKPAQFLFNAGHDWEIVLIVERANFERVKQGFQALRADLAEIGVVKEGYQKGIEFETLSGETRPVPLFTDEKFVLHAAEERVVDWEELGQHLGL
jgi:thiamin-phosphate kinase